jgi:uncharacterized protein involved in exopolysaccharide biosynthesis
MFDFIGKKSDQKEKAKQPAPQSPDGGPDSLLDVVVPFRQVEEKLTPAKPDSLLSQIDALSRKHEQNLAEKQAMERAELRAKRATYERAEQETRLKAEQEASQRFKQKADLLDQEIERVRRDKIQEMSEAEIAKAAYLAPDPAYQPQAPQPVQTAARQDGGYPHTPSPQNHAPYPPHYDPTQVPTAQMPPQMTAAPTEPRAQGYASWPTREQASVRQAAPPPYGVPPHDMAVPNPANHANVRPATPPPAPNYPPMREPGLYDSHVEDPRQDLFQQYDTPNQTSLDLEGVLRSVLWSWKLISIMAIIGAVLAGAYSMTLTNKYQAWAELIIDPSDLKVLENQLSPTGYSGEAMIAYLRSQQRIIESSSVLKQVIENEQLLSDKEFNSENSGILGWWDNILPAPRVERDTILQQLVLEKLRKSLVVSRGNGTFVYSIGITTEDAIKSAKIANAVATAYVIGEAAARSKVATDTSGNLKGKLRTLEENVRLAEQLVADYKAEHKIFSSEGKLTSEVQLSRLNEQLANAKVSTINAKTRMEQVQATNLADVISGALPTSLATNTISQLRVRYASLKSNADKLATKLGPRHPERIAAQAELSSARRETSKEIKRIISGTSKEYQRARKRQQNLSQQVMTLKAASVGVSSSLIALHQLERDLAAHQRVYENFLLRSRETGEQEGIASANARIISEATAPLKKVGPQRRVIAVMGLVAGGAAGIILVLLGGIFRGGRRPHDGMVAEHGRQINPQDAAYGEGDRGPYAPDAQSPQMPQQPGAYPPYSAQRPYA